MTATKPLDDLRNEMVTIIIRYTRIKKEHFEKPFINMATWTDVEIAEAYQFLLDFRINEYAELYRIFRLPLDAKDADDPKGYELWDRYFKNSRTNLIEMKLLRAQAKICREKWQLFPKFKKGIKNEKEERKENNKSTDSKNPERVRAESA